MRPISRPWHQTSDTPLFSVTYKLPIFYPLCFQIHPCNGGCTPLPVFHGANARAGRKHPGSEGRTTMNFQTCQRVGARERTRTSTTLRSLRPERSASASSATRARVRIHPNRVGLNPEMVDPSRAGITHTTRLFHCARRSTLCQRAPAQVEFPASLVQQSPPQMPENPGIAHLFLQSPRVEI